MPAGGRGGRFLGWTYRPGDRGASTKIQNSKIAANFEADHQFFDLRPTACVIPSSSEHGTQIGAVRFQQIKSVQDRITGLVPAVDREA
jgi:hypothetical protein